MPRTFVLRDEIIVQAPIERCFLLSTNLEIVALTLKMQPTMDRKGSCVQRGDRVRWRGWQLGLPQFHESLIEPFVPPVYFRDSMTAGRFAFFAHDHRFTELKQGGVCLSDEVRFQLPLGWLGECFGRWVLVPHIRSLLRKRFTLLKNLAEGEDWRRYVCEEVARD
jgi:ligand-binding SRPBCC domain-containing protein